MTTYKKMDPVVKEKWIKALRSGRYKQTAGALVYEVAPDKADKFGYCCLGVLAKCTREGKVNMYGDIEFKNPLYDPKDDDNYEEDVIMGEGELPDHLLEKFGLSKAAQSKLIKLNDGSSHLGSTPGDTPSNDFNTIADFIEKYL